MPETEQKYPTIEQRLEEVMHQRGFTSPSTFSKSMRHTSSWYYSFVHRCASPNYSTICSAAERLGLIPAIIHRLDADRTPLFGEGVRHFRNPLDYHYLGIAYVGDILPIERAKKGLSQRALAELAGTYSAQINQCETYRFVPNVTCLHAICRALDLEVEWLAEPVEQSA